MRVLSEKLSAMQLTAAAQVDQAAKRLMAEGRDIIDFGVGEPDFDTPERAQDAGIAAIRGGQTHYTPVPGTLQLREAVCAAFRRDFDVAYSADQIAVTSGAKYAVYAALLAILNPGDEVILPAPYWTSYRQMLNMTGAVPVVVPCKPENGFLLTGEQLRKACTAKTKALILNNPVNPTGALYGKDELLALSDVCRENDLYVISDEIYAKLVYDGRRFVSFASLHEDAKKRSVIISGVSKAYAMTGWRIGYAAADGKIIRNMQTLFSHTVGCPCAISQQAALEALTGPQDETERMRRTFERRRNRMVSELASVPGFRFCIPNGAFYVLCDVSDALKEGETDISFAVAMLERADTAVVPCTEFGLSGAVRLCYAQDEARIGEGIGRIRRFMEERV